MIGMAKRQEEYEEKKKMKKSDENCSVNSQNFPCPVCNKSFPSNELQLHAETCAAQAFDK